MKALYAEETTIPSANLYMRDLLWDADIDKLCSPPAAIRKLGKVETAFSGWS